MKFKNRDKEIWTVDEAESERIDMGGFLMTHRHRGEVQLNARLSSEDKTRGRKTLFGWLFDRSVGTSGTKRWDP